MEAGEGKGGVNEVRREPFGEDPERNRAILERIPTGRWGTPEDLQGIVVFLASEASDYINGYTVAVDGGWLAR
jgi:2-deoxy-D-gluconate 3-dehydrogenase